MLRNIELNVPLRYPNLIALFIFVEHINFPKDLMYLISERQIIFFRFLNFSK